jgi:hypothetical protein
MTQKADEMTLRSKPRVMYDVENAIHLVWSDFSQLYNFKMHVKSKGC